MSAVLETPAEGYKGGSTAPHSATEASDSLHSTAYARILDLICEGPIRGFHHGGTNPLQDVYLNETPVANPDGTLNFSNIQIDSRSGTLDQAYMPGFSDAVENEFDNPVELRYGTPWTQALTNLDLTAVRVRLSVPSLQKTDTSTGDITGTYIAYTVELSTDGGAFQTVVTSGFAGKTTSKYERTHRIVLPTATTGWTVRITRTTTNANAAYVADTTTVEGYTEIIDAKLRYPNSALIGILFDAQQFSTIPSRAYDLYGRIVRVPSNYDPDARTYTGAWDGSFKLAWTNNPAWIFYDVATNSRFSVGRYVSDALMNKWALYDIGQYCDEMVPDGKGGQEPRFTATLYLQTPGDAYRVLGDMVSIFRGQMYWAAGAIQASADKPGTPDYAYNQSNVIGGRFTYAGSRRKTRYTVAMVSWNDPADFGRAKVATVVDPDGLRRYGYQPTSLIAVGCSSLGQAQRAGYWTLYTSRLDTGTCTWKVGIDGTVAAPGRIVTVSDPARAGKRMGGRVTRATPSTTTDVFVDSAPGQVAIGDTLYITTSAAVTESRTISAINGTQLTVGTPFSEAPAPDSVWQVEASTLQTAKYRILSVREPSSNAKAVEWEMVGLLHNESKFAAVDIGAEIETPPITSIPPAVQPAPTTVILSTFQVKGAVATTLAVNIQWTPTTGATRYLVEWRRDSGDWTALPPQRALSADINSPKPGVYEARVYAINASGKGSLPTYANSITLADPTDLPTTVAEIQTQANNASTDSTNALQQLAYIASDNRLTQGEKPIAIKDYSVVTSEQAGIDAEADRYSITTEKADYDGSITALTNLLATYTTPTAWNDLGGDTDIVGATWRSTWEAVYSKRQILLNKILASAKAATAAAQTTADANAGGVVNPRFANGLSGWGVDTLGTGEWYSEAGANSPDASVSTYLVHAGVAGQVTTTAHNTGGGIAVSPGQVVTAAVALRSVNANTGSKAYARIGWFNSAGTEIANSTQGATYCSPDAGTNKFTQGVSRVYGTAPAGATRAVVEVEYDSHTSGYYNATNATIGLQPGSIGEVADGGGYAKVRSGQLSNGILSMLQNGRNCIFNPTFTQNAVGTTNGAGISSGTIIDGWTCTNGSATAICIPYNGMLYSRVLAGFIVNAGSSGNAVATSGAVANCTAFSVIPNAPYAFSVSKFSGSSIPQGSIPAGVSAYHRVYIGFKDSFGNYVRNDVADDNLFTTRSVVKMTGTVPSNATQAIVYLYIYFLNTGAAWTIPSGQTMDADISAIEYVQAADLDNEVLDGTNFGRVRKAALLGGSPLPTPNGKQVFGNPTFSNNTIGTATGTTFTSGPVVDGYSVYAISSNFVLMWEAGSGDPLPNMGAHPYMTLRSGTIANGGNAVCWMRAGDVAPCTPGQVFNMRVDFYQTWNVTPPSGVTRALRVSMLWYRADGSNISGSESLIELTANGGAQTVSGTATAPAGAAYGIFYFGLTVYNNSGAAWANISPYPFDSRIHYASCISVQDLSAEVTGTLASQRRLPLVTWGNYGGGWSGLTVSYSTTTTSCTFSASAANYIGGGDSIAYNSGSVTVSGSAGATVTYWLFYDDPGMTGGSKTLQATTDSITSLNAAGRVLVIKVSVTYPTSGTGSGGGSGSCPSRNAWVYAKRSLGGEPEFIRAGEVEVGHYLLLTSGRWGRVSYSKPELSPCVTVRATNGKTLTCSESAPLELSREKGTFVRADRALHHSLRVYYTPDSAGRETAVDVTPEGVQWVQHITCEHDSFLCGDDPSCMFGHHNMKPLS